MKSDLVALAGGVAVLALCAVAAAGRTAERPSQSAAGRPRFVNARVEERPAGSGLADAFRAEVAARRSAAWIAYAVPAVSGGRQGCDWDRPDRVYLEGRAETDTAAERQRVALEGSREVAILFRAESGAVQKLRVFSTDCELDAGGLPVAWLEGVVPAESVALLRGMVGGKGEGRGEGFREDRAIMAIALHADPSAQQALEGFLAAGHPDAVRRRAAFLLGAARGDEGFRALRRQLAAESDPAFRRELVFPVSLNKSPESADTLIQLAKSDSSPEVRKQAMFWLGQKAGATAAAALKGAVDNDPDVGVKKRAVFGLSRMPNGEGVPLLIEVARTNRSGEVRKQAMFWLGQSNDPRALAFLEEVLKR